MRDITPGKRVLLLQGPMGPFFKKLADWLTAHGSTCWKINLNGGDWFYFMGPNAVDFLGPVEEWDGFLTKFIHEHRIDQVFLFGDCREYHRIASHVCRQLNVQVMVFEEGYIRPDYLTLEEGGVNAFSLQPKSPEFFRNQPNLPEPFRHPAGFKFGIMARAAMIYYLVASVMRWRYWNYEHHRSFSILKKSIAWTLSAIRKVLYTRKDRKLTERLASELSKHYFLVPLQVYNDSQVCTHSQYENLEEFINDVLASFAHNAPDNVHLVFKHHPMDRGHRHYGSFIKAVASAHGIESRVLYGHELHLPTCLHNARGVVLINSTVGLSALLYSIPTKIMGRAMYDIEGLTSQEPLSDFWSSPTPVDRELYNRFRQFLIRETQLNGSFFGRFPFPRLESVVTHVHLDDVLHSPNDGGLSTSQSQRN